MEPVCVTWCRSPSKIAESSSCALVCLPLAGATWNCILVHTQSDFNFIQHGRCNPVGRPGTLWKAQRFDRVSQSVVLSDAFFLGNHPSAISRGGTPNPTNFLFSLESSECQHCVCQAAVDRWPGTALLAGRRCKLPLHMLAWCFPVFLPLIVLLLFIGSQTQTKYLRGPWGANSRRHKLFLSLSTPTPLLQRRLCSLIVWGLSFWDSGTKSRGRCVMPGLTCVLHAA